MASELPECQPESLSCFNDRSQADRAKSWNLLCFVHVCIPSRKELWMLTAGLRENFAS